MAVAADQYPKSHNLFLAMDSLWFQENIAGKRTGKPVLETQQPMTPVLPQDNTLSWTTSSAQSSSSDITEPSHDPIHHPREEGRPSTPPRLELVTKHHSFVLEPAARKVRRGSLSPSTDRRPGRRLAKMNSWKSFSELEHEELKGFMDLGFIFNKDELSPHLMSVLPGLQRLGEKKRLVSRPYSSEAWLINRPYYQLLNLRISPVSAASVSDMKKHLRYWARTVASELQQEF